MSVEEAIQKDVSASTADAEVQDTEVSREEPMLTPRQEAMRAVIDKRSAEMRGDLDDAVNAGSVEREEIAEGIEELPADDQVKSDGDHVIDQNIGEDAEKVVVQSQAAQDLSSALGIYQNEQGQQVARMKINGEEREIPAEQVKAMLQKELSGDLKLQEASERQRGLQEYEQKLRAEGVRLQSLATSQPPVGADEGLREKAGTIIDELVEGDPEIAKDALAEVFKGRQEPTLDTNEVADKAYKRALETLDERDRENDRQKGVETLNSDYAHIMQDANLRNMTNDFTKEIMRQEPTLSPSDVLVKAAKKTDSWISSLRGENSQNEPTSDRKIDKSTLKTIPSGRSAAHVPPKKEQIDNSPAGIIARMAKSRAVM